MLTVFYKNIEAVPSRMESKDWHVGDKLDLTRSEILHVESVYADLEELEHILFLIDGIPQHKRLRYQQWFGDDAKFIANCLRYKI